MYPARLILNTGQEFLGLSPAWQKGDFYGLPSHQKFWCEGEVVFTTGMTGYVETLTDPSYAGQIIVFTYPLIGNYAVPPAKFWESEKIHAAGVVVGEACQWPDTPSSPPSRNKFGTGSYKGGGTLAGWLREQKVPLLTGVDTRLLTKTLREKGATPGAITSYPYLTSPLKRGRNRRGYNFFDPNETDLVALVSPKRPTTYGKGKKRIIAVDCGMKKNLLRSLLKLPLTIKIVPYDYDYNKEKFDGVFISNGPGDPERCGRTIEILRRAMKKKKPIFGVCLGNQLLALAAGAKTYKLPFGHRGQNQPCQDSATGRCYITSQNHGYAVNPATLPPDWRVSFKNLNDDSVEGIGHKSLPFFAVQFHPEAAPGPADTQWLFEKFYETL
ncbi:carbamoyl-phosphate synthase (glutamine-hydrolyzing) small subunit [Patescibacteria group bacterium]|nr:MAG: carbamoyl-phosphate synthase (glutamine-hydrolyzing) small subunit [Patescibacteria group bacterium]